MMMDDVECLYMLLGISMQQLCGPLEPFKILICLQSARYLLQQKYLNKKYFPQELCKEVTHVIVTLIDAGDSNVKLEALKFIRHILINLDENYFTDSWQSLLENLLESTAVCIQAQTNEIFQNSQTGLSVQQPQSLTPVGLEVVQVGLSCFGRFFVLLSNPSQLRFGPSIMFILLRICDLAEIDITYQPLIAAVVEALQTFTKITNSQWQAVLNTTIRTIVKKLLKYDTSIPISNWTPFLMPLFTLIIGLDVSTDLHPFIINVLQNALRYGDAQTQKAVLVGLRNFIVAGSASPSSQLQINSWKYLATLASEIVELLQRVGKENSLNEETVAVASEAVRILVLSETISNQTNNDGSILSVLIPSLIGLLRPNNPSTIHELALQVLIKLASTSPNFKSYASLISEHEKHQFEVSIKQSVAEQQQQARRVDSTVSAAKPLKLDFSKYS